MQRISVLYGKGMLETAVDDANLGQIIEPRFTQAADEIGEIRRALAQPIGSPRLKKLSRDIKKLVIISSDNTRPVPSRLTIPLLLEELYHEPEYYDITILIATGLHREMTREEIIERFGEKTASLCKIVNHRAQKEEELTYFGELSTGRPLWLNRLVAEAELLIAEGFIEPHFFAGFSGGRKSILPGVAGAKTIMNNHCPANIAHPRATIACLEGNPIHLEALEAACKSGLAFILNVALNQEKRVIKAFAGHFDKAHMAGCAFVKEQMSVPTVLADIVITSNNGYPLDRNVYQLVKGMEVASAAVRKGGVIVIAGDCIDGIGHGEFKRLIEESPSIEELYAKVSSGEAVIDQWQVQVFARVLKEHPVILVTDRLTKEEAGRIFLEHAATLEEALELAYRKVGRAARVNVIPEGPVVIPTV